MTKAEKAVVRAALGMVNRSGWLLDGDRHVRYTTFLKRRDQFEAAVLEYRTIARQRKGRKEKT